MLFPMNGIPGIFKTLAGGCAYLLDYAYRGIRIDKMISELLPEEKRKLHELEQQLIELERGSTTIQTSDINMGLNEMSYRLDELDKLVQKESKMRRDDYRRRVQHLRTTYAHIRSSLDNLVRRRDRSSGFDSQKQQLFEGGSGQYTSASVTDMESGIAESGSLQRSSQMLNEYLNVGQETLANLTSQRESLKGIQRKALDILNSLGIANSIMRAVEGRDSGDRMLVFGGMLVILLLLVFVYFYLM